MSIILKSFRSDRNYVTAMGNLEECRKLGVGRTSNNICDKTSVRITEPTAMNEGKGGLDGDVASLCQMPTECMIFFHVSDYLDEAADAVRGKESRELVKSGDKRLADPTWLSLTDVTRQSVTHDILRRARNPNQTDGVFRYLSNSNKSYRFPCSNSSATSTSDLLPM